METGNGSTNTISLIMEVEEIAPEEVPSDSDSIECAIMRSSNSKDDNKLSQGSEMSCSVKVGVKKTESIGKKYVEDSIKDKIKISKEEISGTIAFGQDAAGSKKGEDAIKMQSSVPESRLVALGSGEVLNTGSLEEKLSAMFEEDKNEYIKPSNNDEDQSGPTLEEQLTELFQDKSEGDEMPSSTTEVVSSPMEENLIAIFEEEDSGKSLSNQVFISESKCHRKEHVRNSEVVTDKELPCAKDCSVLLEKNVHISSKVSKNLTEKKMGSLKRKITEKGAEHIDFMKEMKEARVVLKKLKLPASDVVDIKMSKLPNKDIENVTNHKPVVKNNSLSQNSMLKLSDEKPNECTSRVSTVRKNTQKISALPTVAKAKDKAADKITIPTDSLSQQELKKKKSARLSNRNSTDTSQPEKLKLKPEKQPVKTETLPNLEITKTKTSESPKAPVKEQSVPEIVKRKRGRPPLNRNKESILSSKTDTKKPVKTLNKVQESPLVSRVSERLQLKMMKTRAVRKRKLHGGRHEVTSIKLKTAPKREHILKLHRTAISLAKKRKTTSFTTYGLARKRRLLNAVKTASTTRKQLSVPLMNIKEATAKHKGPAIKENNLENLPKVTVALTPVLLQSSGNLVKTTLKAKSIHSDTGTNKKNTNVKSSHLSAESSFTDSETEQRNTQKKSDHKVSNTVPLKRLMVTRSKGELGQKKIQQKKKGIGLRTIHAVKAANKKKIDDSAKAGKANTEVKKKNITACGIDVRNNEGVVELFVEDATNLTANDIKDRGIDKTTMPGKISPAGQKNSSTVEVPSGMTDAQKMVEMRKAIWNLETRIDRYKLRQQAEERMVVYLSNKLHFYENNKYVQALMRMLKDAAPGPQQNQDAVFITDLLLGYCPENDNYFTSYAKVIPNEEGF